MAKTLTFVESDPKFDEKKVVSTFRRILPQLIASFALNLVYLNEGTSSTLTAITIPELTSNNQTTNETIHLTSDESSWLGGVMYIVQPVACIIGGMICEAFGRKISLILVIIPSIIAWFMFYLASTALEIFIANSLFGFSLSSTIAVTMSYTGEIYESSVRGILTNTNGAAMCIGLFAVFALNMVSDWRSISLYCAAVPILTLIPLLIIPESPYWYVTKNRNYEAIKALSWLRGWKLSSDVQREFNEMEKHKEISISCEDCIRIKRKCFHPQPTFWEKLCSLRQSSTMKPFFILSIVALLSEFSGAAIRVYIVQIFKALGSPIDVNSSSMIASGAGAIGIFFCILTIRWFGKRNLFLVGIIGAAACEITLAVYGFMNAPSNFTSFDVISDEMPPLDSNYVGFTFMILRSGFMAIVLSVPETLYTECFPLKTRSFAIGLMFAVCCLIQFAAIKLHYNFEIWLTLPGTFALYGSIGVIGLIFSFFLLPETENRTLDEIERHFSSKNHRWTDLKIKTHSTTEL